MHFISCCCAFHKENSSSTADRSLRLWQQCLVYLLALGVCIFNKRHLAEESPLEIVLSWESLGLLQRDPRAAGAGREAARSWESMTPAACMLVETCRCGRFIQSWRLHTFFISLYRFSLLFLFHPRFMTFLWGSQLKQASVLQLPIYHLNCVCWSQCQQQESPMVAAVFCKMLVMFGKWTACVPRAPSEDNGTLSCSTVGDHPSPFDYWLFLSLEYILNISVESSGRGVILSKLAEGNEWK